MCAIVGVVNSQDAASIAYYALFSMQHRGQEASGISASDGKLCTIKGNGLVTEVFSAESFKKLNGDMAVGHNRYATAGSASAKDAQPVAISYALGELSIVHNGNLVNKDEVRERLVQNGAIFSSNMDTENIAHLIARSTKSTLKERIKEALGQILGAYCLLILEGDAMYVVRDRWGVRPLSIGRLKDGGLIVASETCAFDLVGAKFIRDVRPGEMLSIKRGQSEFTSEQLYESEPRICAFEYIYFARPDSVIEGKSVYASRKRMGAALARAGVPKGADMVVAVPDSGVAAALGYAKESGLAYEAAIVRNHYVGRTFIEPTQELRNLKVKLKLNPMSSELAGKSVVVVDDSIVRGTTSKKIVALLRTAGARQVHFRVAAPELRYSERYGIDTPTSEELISYRLSCDEVCEYIGADSLEFLGLDALVEALGSERKYSLVSFDGDYFIR